jgi:hypothetical protein
MRAGSSIKEEHRPARRHARKQVGLGPVAPLSARDECAVAHQQSAPSRSEHKCEVNNAVAGCCIFGVPNSLRSRKFQESFALEVSAAFALEVITINERRSVTNAAQ